MSDFAINLNLLVDMIKKKKTILEQVLNITLNQRELLGKEEGQELFVEMNKQKQNLIDEVLVLDNIFQRKFDSIVHNFNSKVVVEAYRDKIVTIQDCTKSILRLDNEIRVEEDKNTKYLKEVKINRQQRIEKIKESRKNDVINLYKSNNKNS